MRYLYMLTVLLMPVFSSGNGTQAAGDAFSPNCRAAYTELTQFRIRNARQRLALEPAGNGFRLMLEDYADLIQVFTTENQREFERLADVQDTRLDQLETLPESSPYTRFLQAEVSFHRALLCMKFGHELKAGQHAIAAYKLLVENQKAFPDFTPNLKTLGVMHVLIGSVPDNFRWITRLLGLKGNVRQGLSELERATHDPVFGDEAAFYRFFVNGFVIGLTNQNRLELARFVQAHPENLAVNFMGAALYLKDNQSDNAYALIQKRPAGSDYLPMPVYDQYLADIALQRGQYPLATKHYTRFQTTFHGQSFRKDVLFRLAMAGWLSGDEKAARGYLDAIPKTGKALTESDKVAQKFYADYAGTHTLPDPLLLKARFQSDGGYFREAWATIAGITELSLPTQAERAELNFRKGRIQQKLNEHEKAIPYFQRAVALADKQDHVGASSCLQLGYIYQSRRNNQLAIEYFGKAITYEKHEYKNSIDNKAKAAISAITAI
nr:tetratricopeptide repeat protein [uncultured Arsenicibacter sp.]